MTSFVTRHQMELVRAATLKSGLKLYAKTGMRPNRAYSPTAMMRAASQITGQTFKARDYAGAIKALQTFIDANLER